MEFDLVSAYSVRVSWGSDFEAHIVECHGISAARCDKDDVAVVLVNLQPSTTYNIRICSKTGETITKEVTTSEYEKPCFENLYESIRNADGVYDTTNFEKELHDIFLENFSQIVHDGDKILANVNVNGSQQNVETVAVRDGSTMKVETNSNVFLPFSVDSTSRLQTVTLSVENEKATLAYEPRDNMFGYAGETYSVGDKFEMFGKMVTVADGSIVLLFSDTVQKVWPFLDTKALAVVGDAGSHFMKNITANVSNLMCDKATGETSSTHNSAWVHNTTTSTTDEITRMVHTIDENTEDATISIGVLHTDASLNKFIEPTLQMTYDSTTISAQDAADATASATFTSNGLQFDTNAAAIYFGASQEFRIMYDSTNALLLIQSYDATLLDYVNKAEYST